uniref:Ubiquitin-related modifier 1 n=1 Tax=Anas platyrhynchos TaxID=8839 RepID=A0A8B9QUE9_ANAPL
MVTRRCRKPARGTSGAALGLLPFPPAAAKMAAPVSLQVEFGGGAELLFDGVKKHQVTLPSQPEPWDIRNLLKWIKTNLLKERPELVYARGICVSTAAVNLPCASLSGDARGLGCVFPVGCRKGNVPENRGYADVITRRVSPRFGRNSKLYLPLFPGELVYLLLALTPNP